MYTAMFSFLFTYCPGSSILSFTKSTSYIQTGVSHSYHIVNKYTICLNWYILTSVRYYPVLRAIWVSLPSKTQWVGPFDN